MSNLGFMMDVIISWNGQDQKEVDAIVMWCQASAWRESITEAKVESKSKGHIFWSEVHDLVYN